MKDEDFNELSKTREGQEQLEVSAFMHYVSKCAKQDEKLEQADALIKSLDEYIVLLGRELDTVIGVASIHGWRSQLVKEGEEARETIDRLRGYYNSKG